MNPFKNIIRLVALLACLSSPLAVQADDFQEASSLFRQGQHAQALGKVNAVLAVKPKDAQARFLKGLILDKQGDSAAAIKVFSDLTADYPELPEPYNNLAVLYAGQDQYEKAKIALEMAIRTHPAYATAHENLGDIYAKMASQAYDRALQLDKSNPSTQTKLALIGELFSGKTARTAKPAAVAQASNPPAAVPAAAAATAAPKKSDPVAEVLKTTQEWAAAWSAQNSGKYLGFYAGSFAPPSGMSRSAWEAQRTERIAAPKSIRVEVRNAKVRLIDDNHASVSFTQSYRASHLNTTSAKTLEWVRENGVWLIAAERSGR